MYTVTMHQLQPVFPERVIEGSRLILKYAPFAAAIAPLALGLVVTRRLSACAALWVGMAVAALPATFLPWAKRGGFYNDFLPVAFLAGPVVLLLLFDAARALSGSTRVASGVRWTGYGALACFLALHARDPRVAPDGAQLAPTAENTRRADVLNERIARLTGGVIAPRAPLLPVRHGDKTQQYSDMPYMDLGWSKFPGANLGPYLDKIGARYALVNGDEVFASSTQIALRYQLDSVIPDPPPTLLGDDASPHYLLRWQDDESGARVVFDFEGPLEGWTKTGDAFDRSPTSPNPPWQNAILGAIGHGLANSYHPDKHDSAVGSLLSPSFVIDRTRLSVRVGGGWLGGTQAELRVAGRTVRVAKPIFHETEAMTRVVWDVSDLLGQNAQLAIVDESTGFWGHITCDDVVLY
jgi:hypothetical protein